MQTGVVGAAEAKSPECSCLLLFIGLASSEGYPPLSSRISDSAWRSMHVRQLMRDVAVLWPGSARRAAGRPPIDSATVRWTPPRSPTSLTNCGASTV